MLKCRPTSFSQGCYTAISIDVNTARICVFMFVMLMFVRTVPYNQWKWDDSGSPGDRGLSVATFWHSCRVSLQNYCGFSFWLFCMQLSSISLAVWIWLSRQWSSIKYRTCEAGKCQSLKNELFSSILLHQTM